MRHTATVLLAVALPWLSLGGCEPFEQVSGLSDNADRCVALNQKIADCLGQELRALVCDGISDTDLENLSNALDAGGCEAIGGAAPIDGDIRSSYCRLLGEGCISPFAPEPEYRPTRFPVVLVNGIDVSPAFRYSDRILEVMRQRGGHDVHLAIDTPFETPARRAAVLWERIQEIKAKTGAPKVNLVCHSLGGLDCRYLVSPGGLHWDVDASQEELAGSVASITTVSTAHHGTKAADAALGLLPDADRFAAVDSLATFLGDWFTEARLEDDVHLRESIAALSEAAAPAFNAEIVDAEGVYYQSWGGFSQPFGSADDVYDAQVWALCQADEHDGLEHWRGIHDHMALPLVPGAELVGTGAAGEPFVPNDGLCSVVSARWGYFRGCVPADHMEQLGQRNLPDVNVRTGFDIAWFYSGVATELAGYGF